MADEKKDVKPEFATREEIDRAIDCLSASDEVRLEKFARYRIRGLGRKAMGRDYEDLLQEAIRSTLAGAEDCKEGRHWRKEAVTFVQHLFGAMRSIASHWKEAVDDNEAQLEADLIAATDDGETQSPLENALSGMADQEREVLAKEELGAVFRFFQNDDDAALVIEGIREGWSGPEIMERLDLPKNRYEAAVKRIRYHVK